MLSSNIAKLRKRNGLTQIEFAKKLHVTQSAVSHWESGRSMPDTTQLFNIAQFFGMTVDELSSGTATIAKPETHEITPPPEQEKAPADMRAEAKKLLESMTDQEYERAIAILRLLKSGEG
jgi:transcriptional regulator with XRE-family HTH domain